MSTLVHLKVDGMTCSACSSTVERAVGSIQGVSQVHVDLSMGLALIEVEGNLKETSSLVPSLIQAIDAVGFDAVLISAPIEENISFPPAASVARNQRTNAGSVYSPLSNGSDEKDDDVNAASRTYGSFMTRAQDESHKAVTFKLRVNTMHCASCVGWVTNAVREVDGTLDLNVII